MMEKVGLCGIVKENLASGVICVNSKLCRSREDVVQLQTRPKTEGGVAGEMSRLKKACEGSRVVYTIPKREKTERGSTTRTRV